MASSMAQCGGDRAEAGRALSRFRVELHRCLTVRGDELSGLADAVLCADENGLEDLIDAEREQVSQAVTIVRRHRTVTLGMPRLRQALPRVRPERTA